jgi:putative intracellular protease/amidase
MTSPTRVRTLGAILYPDFELLDLYGPLEMFGCLGPELRIETVAQQAGPVRSAQGPETVARYGFADAPALDLLLLPGGLGTLPQLANEALHEFLRTRARSAEVAMSVCSGSALFARARPARRAARHVEQDLLRARARAEREGRVDRAGALGRGRTVRDRVGRVRGHRHGARRDRASVRTRARRGRRDRHRIPMARRRRGRIRSRRS